MTKMQLISVYQLLLVTSILSNSKAVLFDYGFEYGDSLLDGNDNCQLISIHGGNSFIYLGDMFTSLFVSRLIRAYIVLLFCCINSFLSNNFNCIANTLNLTKSALSNLKIFFLLNI